MRCRRTTVSLLANAGLLFGLLLATDGCKQSDSILLIEVSGPKDLVPFQLRVTISAGLDAHTILVPLTRSKPIVLPASFTIALDRSHAGPVEVSIDALDKDGLDLNFAGNTMMKHIEIGGQIIISVNLIAVPPPDSPDAGTDGPGDAAGGAGGSGGAGGGAGQGGGSGQGGSSGADGATDGDDAMGLDGGTD